MLGGASGRALIQSGRTKDEAARAAIPDHLREEPLGGAKSLVVNKGYARYLWVAKGAVRIYEDNVLAESHYDGKYVLRTNIDLPAPLVRLDLPTLEIEAAATVIKERLKV